MTTKSVMSPMLWLLGISLTTLLPTIYFTTGHIQELLTYSVVVIIAAALVFFAYFAIKEPDRLQSEDYLIEQRRIALLGETGRPLTTIDLTADQTPNIFVEGDAAGADKNA
ncbi:hypothetical protein [Rhizobium esperanzae]|uniref:Uncharacterized protein n=1 Tax=Rhizobium esperanzae TaxID=1967781 RepID=A0A7W6R4F2_9HYPH|nr:hypothetical protein [Rhizobium esperanzae]MBB4236671.1 hypothetical protein [Rhizobium esperanzae]